MKRSTQNQRINLKWLVLLPLFLFLINSIAFADDGGLIEVSSELISSAKWLIAIVILVFAAVVYLAFAAGAGGGKFLIQRGTLTENGRDNSASFREMGTVILVGAFALSMAFVAKFEPDLKDPNAMMALEDDPNRELTEAELVFLEDATSLENGHKKYTNFCAVCHGDVGQGTVGPNLTDDFWIYGGSIKDIFVRITEGVPDKGMIAWESTLTPVQRLEVASYVRSLLHSEPANPKDPQGELWIEGGNETEELIDENSDELDDGAEEEGEEIIDLG